jgi:diamine N-acetyltransferase
MSPRLEIITPENVRAACRVAVTPEQNSFVAPVPISLAEAYVHAEKAWPRLIVDGDDAVGFVMAGINPTAENESRRYGIWRLNIDAAHQGKGYGRFAVGEVLAEFRRRGARRATVSWVEGDGGPRDFYLKLGFTPIGEHDGETVGEIVLD